MTPRDRLRFSLPVHARERSDRGNLKKMPFSFSLIALPKYGLLRTLQETAAFRIEFLDDSGKLW